MLRMTPAIFVVGLRHLAWRRTRNEDGEGGTAGLLSARTEAQPAAIALHDIASEPEAQTSASATLCGEKLRKQFWPDLGADAAARVRDRRPSKVSAVDRHARDTQMQHASAGHGVERIANQVDDGLP